MSENKKVIYIVGMGPGSISGMSGDAVEALHKSDMIKIGRASCRERV